MLTKYALYKPITMQKRTIKTRTLKQTFSCDIQTVLLPGDFDNNKLSILISTVASAYVPF